MQTLVPFLNKKIKIGLGGKIYEGVYCGLIEVTSDREFISLQKEVGSEKAMVINPGQIDFILLNGAEA